MDFPAVYQTIDRHTCILVGVDEKGNVLFVRSEEGVTDLKKLPLKEFDRLFTEIPNYPILRAARLYLNPLSAAIEITPPARKALNQIVEASPTTEEPNAMNTVEATTVKAQQNVNATVKAGLKTGTKGVDPKAVAKAEKTPSAPAATEAPSTKSKKEKTVSTKKTTEKKAKAATKAPAKKAAKKEATKAPAKKAAKKEATKAPAKKAAKLVKKAGASKAPAKKAAKAPAKKNSTRVNVAGTDLIVVNPKSEMVPKSGAVRMAYDFVASKGAKGVARDDVFVYMLKHDKADGADQRAKYNIGRCLRKGIFVAK